MDHHQNFCRSQLEIFLDKDNEIWDLTALDQGHPEKTYSSFIFKSKQELTVFICNSSIEHCIVADSKRFRKSYIQGQLQK